ncbi:MAG: hypothetical protein ACUVX8_18225, partial [Candidatus Zipacnadales bacterium]
MRSFSTGFRVRQLAPRVVASALLIGIALAVVPGILLAQKSEIATVAVVPFQDKTERQSSLLAAKATDAVALALQDSKEFLVTPAREVEREMASLNIQPPLSVNEAVRLGKRLDVDSVALGEVLVASADERTGRGTVRLQLMVVDVEAAELLDGATITAETKPLPGYTGTEAEILNEALRQGAEQLVAEMLASRIPRGTVEAVLPSGTCEINIGSQDGVRPGMKMVVMRPVYIKDLEMVTLRKIGRVEISTTQPDISYADPLRNVAPRTGDYVLRVYEPELLRLEAAAKQQRTKFLWGAAALALLVGLAGVATGTNETTAPPTPISYLHQNAMGDTPVIRIEFAQLDKAWGHLLFRGHSAGFPADAPYLVEVVAGPGTPQRIKIIDDTPQAIAQQDRTITVSFRDEEGDPTTEDVDCTWTHPALVPGEAYFHKVRRVTEPAFPPGTNPPLSQTGGTDNVFQDPTNQIDVGGDWPMLSDATKAVGPVTYILPPQLIAPAPNASSQDTTAITFEWQPTTGADEYMVEVFDSSDPSGLRQPIFHREGIHPRGVATLSETWRPAAGDLEPLSIYYWRVGARKSTELSSRKQGYPRVGAGSNELIGWVLSEVRSFETADIPPPPPSGGTTNVAGTTARPGRTAGVGRSTAQGQATAALPRARKAAGLPT